MRAKQVGLIQPGNQPQGSGELTMMGMVLARDRICLTSRYLSYRGFITWRSFLVTWKAKQDDEKPAPAPAPVPACSGLGKDRWSH